MSIGGLVMYALLGIIIAIQIYLYIKTDGASLDGNIVVLVMLSMSCSIVWVIVILESVRLLTG